MTTKTTVLTVSDLHRSAALLETTPERAGLARIFKLLSALELELVVRPRGTAARRSEW